VAAARERTGATLRWFKVTPDGRLDLDPDTLITERTKIVAVTGQSNVTGVIPPVTEIARLAHEVGRAGAGRRRPVGAAPPGRRGRARRGLPRLLRAQDARPATGSACCTGSAEVLEALPPFLAGGSMIEVVRMEGSTFLPPPQRFEPGVPPARRGRAWPPPSTTCPRSAWRTWPRTRSR
jgi:cysteine desulfurase/selenocysteine lyase